MKKVVRILSIVLLGVMLTGVGSRLISCKNDSHVYPDRIAQKDQGFRYMVSEDEAETTAIILGRHGTSIKDVLVIPEKLGGYRVKQIGYYESYSQLAGAEQYWGIYAKDFSKIVINSNVNVISGGITQFYGLAILNHPDAYIPLEVGINCMVRFQSNGGALTTYTYAVFYDGTIPKPVDPVKEGATFAGWYKDEELTEEWDFENDIVNSRQLSIYLYAKWLEK